MDSKAFFYSHAFNIQIYVLKVAKLHDTKKYYQLFPFLGTNDVFTLFQSCFDNLNNPFFLYC